MILIDSRIGSKDLIDYLPSNETTLLTLEYADAAFLGDGEGGKPIPVGIEIKTVPDALQCITNGRFAGHQLPGLLRDYKWIYLLIEGRYRKGKTGILEMPQGRGWKPITLGSRAYRWRDFESWLTTMETMGGVHVRRSFNRAETAEMIQGLHDWWTRKEFSEHRAHLVPDTSKLPVLATKVSLLRRIANELPGIGWKKSKLVEEEFSSVRDMLDAPPERWLELKGIGKGIVEKVMKGLNSSE